MAKTDLEINQGHLLHNIVLFGRLLRRLDINVTPTHLINLVKAMKYLDLSQYQDVQNASRTILINHHQNLALFDLVFDLFWKANISKFQLDSESLLQKFQQIKQQLAKKEGTQPSPSQDNSDKTNQDSEIVPIYSAHEILRQKDFSKLTENEITAVKKMMKEMKWELEKRQTRRKVRNSTGSHLDMRQTLRHNLRHCGELIQLKWKRPKQKRRPLVVLCDISGSMETYSRLLLQFIYIISNGLKKTETFVFGTRLTRITHHLKHRNIEQALSTTTDSIQDWAGGTRIGETLKTFNYQWGRRVLGQGALIIIISDGWDRGDTHLLSTEMSRLQRSCQRLIWLNPLLGSPGYEPLTRGIQAALPHIDDFLPVHNLASLEELGTLLERLNRNHFPGS
jgi:hypothetical protein